MTTARLVITTPATAAQRAAVLALLKGAVATKGRLDVARGLLSRENATAWTNDRLRSIAQALAGRRMAEPLVRMVAAAVTTCGLGAEVVS